MMKTQKYGVEIEFTGITRARAAEIVANVLGTVASAPDHTVYHTRIIRDAEGRKWKVMRDSSIDPERSSSVGGDMRLDEYRVEFVTPPLRYEDIETLQKIVRELRTAGGKANSSCGIHVHVDGANHDAKSLRRLVKFFSARQNLVYEGLEIAPSRANQWCKPVSTALIDEMSKKRDITRSEMEAIWYSPANDGYHYGIDHSHYNYTRYHGLNLHSFFSKGTVEFRLFNSTLHAGKIKAYVQFCLAASRWAIITKNNGIFQNIETADKAERARLWENTLTKRFDLVGEEFATCRLHMMQGFRDSAAA